MTHNQFVFTVIHVHACVIIGEKVVRETERVKKSGRKRERERERERERIKERETEREMTG